MVSPQETQGVRRTTSWRSRWIYAVGTEPDARFTLANERTFLAWTRTALALIAAGVALEALALPLHPVLRMIASLLLLGAGVMVPLLAWVGWGRVERALRRGDPLPGSIAALPLAVMLSVVALLIVVGLLLGA